MLNNLVKRGAHVRRPIVHYLLEYLDALLEEWLGVLGANYVLHTLECDFADFAVLVRQIRSQTFD